MPRYNTEDGLWNSFESNLVRRLLGLSPGNFLVISLPGLPASQYVQFAVQPDWTLQGEVSCGELLREHKNDALLALGWDAPDSRGGWMNYRIFWQASIANAGSLGEADIRDAATVAKQTLRGIFSYSNPRDLEFSQESFD